MDRGRTEANFKWLRSASGVHIHADLITPLGAYLRLRDQAGASFLLESVEHGERWSRWSFIGRNPLATLTARGLEVETSGALPAGVPLDQGILAAIEHLLEVWKAPQLDDLPPLLWHAELGMSTEGKIPFASTFACFLTRAYDFMRMAVYSRPKHLVLCGSHAGSRAMVSAGRKFGTVNTMPNKS